LIGIETYQKQGISSVQFAQADAAAMKDVLVQHFGVPAENITLWLDSDATRSAFENDLPYPSRAEITLMDSNHRPLLQPVVLDITESAGGLSVSARQ
jgi:hypothetical protein